MSYIYKDPNATKPTSPPVNKGQAGWENEQQSWKSDFSTQRQKTENITVEQSLDIIEQAQSEKGITVHVTKSGSPNQNGIPTAQTLDGNQISLRVRDAKAVEDSEKKSGPAANPFLKKDARIQPKQRNIADLP